MDVSAFGNLTYVLEVCGLGGVLLWLAGYFSLQVAARKAGREFRGKGYIKPPSGRGWVTFLLGKQYEVFDQPGIRFFFGVSRFCLIVLIFDLVAVAILLGCVLLLYSMSGAPVPGFSPGG